MREVVAVILAAGYGKRMKSKTPKVMHRVCGRPMVTHVIDAASAAGASKIILVISSEVGKFEGALGENVDYCIQEERLGTGHAVMQARAALAGYNGDVLVLLGDMPLLPAGQLRRLIEEHRRIGVKGTVLSSILEDATGYGRIVRGGEGFVERIVEERDASAEERTIREMNTGVFCFDSKTLFGALDEVKPNNAQHEFYLTDVPAIMRGKGLPVAAVVSGSPQDGLGVNSRAQLAEAGEIMRRRILIRLMEDGVTIVDPSSTYVDAGVTIGPDTILYPMTILEGTTHIGEDCHIGPSTRLLNASVGDSVHIQNSVVLDSSVGNGCSVGPFAYIRPDCILHENVKVGDFVELKKAEVMRCSKIPHLSYVGDATVGENVNIGCGTITCNYDGKHKHRTVIGDRAFIGSNTNLVAPVTVGSDALVAAGSTITKDVPSHALAVGRARQDNKENWRHRQPTPAEKENH